MNLLFTLLAVYVVTEVFAESKFVTNKIRLQLILCVLEGFFWGRKPVIRCNLSRMMGERRLKVAELAELTGLHRSRIDLLYNEKAIRIDLDVLEKLCLYFDCEVGEFLQLVKE